MPLFFGHGGLIDSVKEFDEETAAATPRYFNLQGVEVERPANGLYIVKRGSQTEKVFFN